MAKTILKLTNNKKLLKKIQKENFYNPLRFRDHSTRSLDALILNQNNYASFKSSKYKILHISTFGEKNDHRTFNLSISNKITKGFIRNNNDVINLDYREKNLAGKDASFDLKIKDIQERVKEIKVDDKLAKEVGEENLDNLKKKLMKKCYKILKLFLILR